MSFFDRVWPYILGVLGSFLFAAWAIGLVQDVWFTRFGGMAFMMYAITRLVVREYSDHQRLTLNPAESG